MSENLIIDINASKSEKYEALLPQIESLIAYETSLTANLANVSAALREVFGWWWVGFYLVDGEELVLGPFQGPVACTRIRFGRGVCGTAWKEAKSQLVPDVEKFPGHIACSSASVSEIVIPVIDINGKVLAVLDVDSERYDVLDETDVHYLEKLVAMVALIFP